MNGSQEQRPPYQDIPVPPPPPSPGYINDPGLGPVPESWRKNVYGLGNDPRRKSPALAGLLSAMPGLGQVYVGYYQQGFIHMLIVATTIVLLASRAMHGIAPGLGFFLGFFWLYNMIDAFRRASFYNHTLAGLTSVELPPDMSLPKGQGSLIGGVALIVVGVLLVANTAFGFSLDWLEDWWPMAFVLMGVYLVYASIAARQKAAARTEPAPQNEQAR